MAQDEPEWFWQRLEAFLARNQLKQTRQRRAVVDQFLQLDDHVDIEDLYRAVKRQANNIGLATVYRTMNLLKDAGLVAHSQLVDGRTVYELLPPDEHHDHLYCTNCGKIDEFEHPQIEALQEEVARDLGYKLVSHRLDLFGLCPDCQ